ncbi:MAG: hypothetical protein EPN88_17520 [Bacteroidetes bacterium]|nr:MAG: hypothetical protein EPN88_17520 [Bacteroidota bacterium]
MSKSKGKKWSIIILVIIINLNVRGQDFLRNYEGIPVIAFAWASDYFTNYNYSIMKAAGIDVMECTDLEKVVFDSLLSAGIKMMPHQSVEAEDGLGNPTKVNYVVKYTDAAYTVWEAEGDGLDAGYVSLKSDEVWTDVINDNGRTVIATKDNISGQQITTTILIGPGGIFYGAFKPGYSQEVRYTHPDLGQENIRNYTSELKLRAKIIDQNLPVEQEQLNSVICRMFIYLVDDNGNPSAYRAEGTFTVQQLLSEDYIVKEIYYNLRNILPQYYADYTGQRIKNFDDWNRFFAERVVYEVEWTNVPNIQLLIDNITVYDRRGKDLFRDPEHWAKKLIEDQINNTNITGKNGTQFTGVSVEDFKNQILTFLPMNEPLSIDHFEPIRFIDNLINYNSNGKKRLSTLFAGCWNNIFGGYGLAPGYVKVFREFHKRGNFTHSVLNYYPYYAAKPNDSINNFIRRFVLENIIEFRTYDPNLSFSVQTGKWLGPNYEPWITETPTREQFRYLINIALMYGVKNIELMNYFSGDRVGGLDDQYISGPGSTVSQPTPLYYELKEIANNRLHKEYGKILKKINQTEQFFDININQPYNFINRIWFANTTTTIPEKKGLDLGFFNRGNNEQYFMLLKKWWYIVYPQNKTEKILNLMW